MKQYSAVVIGLGARGKIHLYGLLNNFKAFKVVGICDRNQFHLEETARAYGIDPKFCYTSAEQMMKEQTPDVMAFATLPEIRLSLVEMAVKYKVKGLMLEKPIAQDLVTADKIVKLCAKNHIKAVVCHQHKYLRSFLKLKNVLDSGELGNVYEIHGSCQPHAAQLGTHYLDYMIWANQGVYAKSVVGHVHGDFYLKDSHPSPDYVFGQIAFENGVRGILECGYFSKAEEVHNTGFMYDIDDSNYWTDDRLTVYGSRGYAWAQCNGKYAAFTSKTDSQMIQGDYHDFSKKEQFDAQILYTNDYAKWLNDENAVHPCNIWQAYHGYQILEGIYLSALKNTRIDLPIDVAQSQNTLNMLKQQLNPVTYIKI